jgi:hypothetical protein
MEGQMSIDSITNDETGKLAGILETKWTRMVDDNNKLDEELKAARLQTEIMQKDVDYWHDRALKAELRGDKYWAEMDFMLQQWNKLRAQCIEVDRTIKHGLLAKDELPLQSEKMPSVVVFNRN